MKEAKPRNNTILIAGAAGYVGSVMTRLYLDLGYRVRVLDRFFFGKDFIDTIKSGNLEVFCDDTRYFSKNLLKNIDVVVDLAGLSNDPSALLNENLTRDINVNGAFRLASLAKEAGVKQYIYTSSCSVYGHSNQGPALESDKLNPLSLYAECKVIAEEKVLSLSDKDFVVTCSRNATCYGYSPRMRFDLVLNIMTLNAHCDGRIQVTGGGKQWRPFIHIADIADAYEIIMKAPVNLIQSQIFNLGSDEQNISMINLAQLVQKNFIGSKIIILEDSEDNRDYSVSFSKIHEKLGFRPKRTIQDGIEEIKHALETHITKETQKTSTVGYYDHLMKMDKLITSLKYNGRLL